MKTKYILAFLIFIGIGGVRAAQVSPEKAGQVARNFYTEKRMAAEPKAAFSLHTERIISLTEKNITLIYVVSFEDAGGFVLVAGDDRIKPVLAYSFEGKYNENKLPPAYVDWIDNYKRQIQSLLQRNPEQKNLIAREWERYAGTDAFPAKTSTTQVLPLLTTNWDQGCFYNDSCPEDLNSWSCERVPTGCVATTLAQIIKYHNYPTHGAGNHSYTHPDYGIQTANFGNATYLFSLMPDYLTNGNAQVAKLMYHCGVAVDMNYGTNASGAWSLYAAKGLVHYFQYTDSLRLIQRSNYSDSAWNAIVKQQMDLHQPIYYAGANPWNAHAFVCDGYQDSTYFHFNWGWSGSANGYFYLNNLDPGGNTFNDYQEIIIDIRPGIPGACSGTSLLTDKDGDFSDGSYANDYENNANCSWLIQPVSNPAFISLEFVTFHMQDNIDKVNVYDGSSNTAPLLVSFTGNTIPPVVNSGGNALFVEFITNGMGTNAGWSAHYETHYCFPEATFTQTSDTLSDGSGTREYVNGTDCYWLISQAQWAHIALVFTEFDTELDYDFVTVYDGGDTTADVLGTFSGDQLPPVMLSSGNEMLIHFLADGGVTTQGWKAVYSTSVGIPSNSSDDGFRVFPNPAKDKVFVVFQADMPSGTSLEMLDMEGRTVYQSMVGSPQFSVSLDGIAPGVYTMVLQNNKQRTIKKLVIR